MGRLWRLQVFSGHVRQLDFRLNVHLPYRGLKHHLELRRGWPLSSLHHGLLSVFRLSLVFACTFDNANEVSIRVLLIVEVLTDQRRIDDNLSIPSGLYCGQVLLPTLFEVGSLSAWLVGLGFLSRSEPCHALLGLAEVLSNQLAIFVARGVPVPDSIRLDHATGKLIYLPWGQNDIFRAISG